MTTPVLSVVVPCYRDTSGLEKLHVRLSAACASVASTYEVIYIDDGSPDDTWGTISKIARGDKHVLGVRLSRNHGHQLAVTAGLCYAKGQRVLIIDSDLQDPPELLPKMMSIMDSGVDNVYGQRQSRTGVPVWKKICYKAYYKLLSALAGCHIPPDTGDFRLISRRIVDIINEMPEHHRFLRGMISWVGFRQEPVFYRRDARQDGESGYTLAKLFAIAADGITSFSIKPLRAALLIGAVFAILCFGGIVFGVIGFLRGNVAVAGWTSLMVMVLMSSCLQFFMLGVIGEYIGRLFVQSKNRPLYLVMETIAASSAQDTKNPESMPPLTVGA